MRKRLVIYLVVCLFLITIIKYCLWKECQVRSRQDRSRSGQVRMGEGGRMKEYRKKGKKEGTDGWN